jgi:hypothetical protein
MKVASMTAAAIIHGFIPWAASGTFEVAVADAAAMRSKSFSQSKVASQSLLERLDAATGSSESQIAELKRKP